MIGVPFVIQIMANLLVCCYENKWVRKVKKIDLTKPGDLPTLSYSLMTLLLQILVGNLSIVINKYVFLSLNSRKKIQDTLRSHFWTFLST